MANTVRAFVALDLPKRVLQHVGDLIHSLHSLGLAAVSWVRPDGVHLTLKFLGNVEVDNLARVRESLQRAVLGEPILRLHIKGVGIFPSSDKPRVVWVGLAGEVAPLRRLRHRVEESLAFQGFSLGRRSFSPHITLGRVRHPIAIRDIQKLQDAFGMLPVQMDATIQVESISLMRSTLLPNGARYERLHRMSLQGHYSSDTLSGGGHPCS